MKLQATRRILPCTLVAALVASLSMATFAQASSPPINEAMLLEATHPIIAAYENHYIVQNPQITTATETPKEDGGRYVQFFLSFDATLKYDSAAEIPRVQGLANALNLSQTDDVNTLLSELDTKRVAKQVNTNTVEKMDALNLTDATAKVSSNALPLSAAEMSNTVSTYVVDEIKSFISEIEEEYIGESSEFNFDLQANLDAQGNLIELEYGVVNGYSNDISVIIPDTEEAMVNNGPEELDKMISTALTDVAESRSSSSVVAPTSNTSFTYYRVNARDYANRYTSNAAKVTCNNSQCSNYRGTINKAPGVYNSAYSKY